VTSTGEPPIKHPLAAARAAAPTPAPPTAIGPKKVDPAATLRRSRRRCSAHGTARV
jgi:hypothetical protein